MQQDHGLGLRQGWHNTGEQPQPLAHNNALIIALAPLGQCVAVVLAGLVPGREAFAGFSQPAVITVACVLILSRALQTTGAVDVLARRHWTGPAAATPVKISPPQLVGEVTRLVAENGVLQVEGWAADIWHSRRPETPRYVA